MEYASRLLGLVCALVLLLAAPASSIRIDLGLPTGRPATLRRLASPLAAVSARANATKCKAPFAPAFDGTKVSCMCPAGQRRQGKTCTSCPRNYICKAGATAPLLCPNKLVTKARGARRIRECVNPRGYYYKPAGNVPIVTKDQQQRLAAAATSSSSNSIRAGSTYTPASAAAAALDAAAYVTAAETNVTDDFDYPSALPCPPDTWSDGLNFQSTCTPCPPDFKTDPTAPYGSATSPAACLSPPGTFLHPENNTVMPCEVGSYSDDYSNNTSCMHCDDVLGPTGKPLGPGIVTAGSGSNSSAACRVLEPGFALVDVNDLFILQPLRRNQTFVGAKPCPQSYFCPGGDAAAEGTPQACPRGMWTEVDDKTPEEEEAEEDTSSSSDMLPGATSDAACMAPPGHMLPDDGGDMAECPPGTYKEGWDRASSCTPCGEGPWLSDPQMALIWIDPAENYGSTVYVRGSPNSCYIQPGMGIDRTGTASVCPPNTFGNNVERRFGTNPAPCMSCLNGLVTVGDDYRAVSYNDSQGAAVPIGEGGYFDVLACLTPPGFGYTSYGAAPCDIGSYNEGGNLLDCTLCPSSTTTPEAGASSAANCSLHSPGLGTGPNGVESCKLGFYSNGSLSVGSPCTPCPEGTTTAATGSQSADRCELCAAGYGAESASSCTPCQNGYYGPGGADADAIRSGSTECIRCPNTRIFTFPSWNGRKADYKPLPTSRIGATSPSDCLAEYAQAFDGFFRLNLNASHPDYTVVPGRESLGACTSYCSSQDGCAAVTFNYATVQCSVWEPHAGSAASLAADGGIALMTMMSLLDALDWGYVPYTEAGAFAVRPVRGATAAGAAKHGGSVAAGAAAAAPQVPAAAAAVHANQRLQQTKVRASGMGSGYFSFWPGAAAAAALDKGSLVNVYNVTTLNDCLWACNLSYSCAGLVFGALDATGGIGEIFGTGSSCQMIMGQSLVDPRRTLIRAKYTALSPAP